MSGLAFSLVLLAACLHAAWNLLAKRAAVHGTVDFIWLCSAASLVIYLPVVIVATWLLHWHWPNLLGIGVMLGTGVLHLAYFVLLQRGYRIGEMSLVYPLARGSGPLLTLITAMLFLGERPRPLALAGIACIVCGIFLAVGTRLRLIRHAAPSVRYGLGTGATIAAYTLWDKHAVSALALSPILYDFGRNVAQTILITPWTVGKSHDLRRTWTAARWEILGVATLSPLAYILVLTALVTAPVSLVAPMREVSIVIGAFLGARYFAEARTTERVIAAALMLAGIIAIAAS